jgi:hypothetical protein
MNALDLSIQTGKGKTRFDSYFPEENQPHKPNGRAQEEDDDDRDFASLPFPAPLLSLRQDFCAADFDPDKFLCAHQKHGQLDDLLAELRALAKQLEAELTAGVERDYASFIALGNTDASRLQALQEGAMDARAQAAAMADEALRDAQEADAVLQQRAAIRKQKHRARMQLRCIRGVEELAELLADAQQDYDALTMQIDLAVQIAHLQKKTDLSGEAKETFSSLQRMLLDKLKQAVQHAPASEKLQYASLVRRLLPPRTI